MNVSPPPPFANENDLDGVDFCGVVEMSLSPPPPFAKEKLVFDSDGDEDDKAAACVIEIATDSFKSVEIEASVSGASVCANSGIENQWDINSISPL